MDDIQQQIEQEMQSHTRITKWVIIGIILLLLVLVFIRFYGIGTNKMFMDDNTVKILTDSMNARDKIREQQYKILERKYLQDSVRLSSIQRQVNNVPLMISNISKKYDQKRVDINHQSIDSQYRYFADWLSQTDSL